MPKTTYEDIYALVRQVPRGQVATYGQIALLVGRCTPRMVGYAMAGLDFDSDVPWHRVINRLGRISPRAGDGAELQRTLLQREGVGFDAEGVIPLRKYRWPGPCATEQESELTQGPPVDRELPKAARRQERDVP